MNEEKNRNSEESNGTEIKELSEKMDKFSSILEKFGMDLITKLGKVTFNIKILTDKVEELSKATIDVKGLKPNLNAIIENQKFLESEIDLLKSMVKKSNFPSKRSEMKVVNKDTVKSHLRDLKDLVGRSEDPSEVVEELETIKKNIFEITGGHKILYTISKSIKELKSKSELEEDYRTELINKVEYWKDNF